MKKKNRPKSFFTVICLFCLALVLGACGADPAETTKSGTPSLPIIDVQTPAATESTAATAPESTAAPVQVSEVPAEGLVSIPRRYDISDISVAGMDIVLHFNDLTGTRAYVETMDGSLLIAQGYSDMGTKLGNLLAWSVLAQADANINAREPSTTLIWNFVNHDGDSSFVDGTTYIDVLFRKTAPNIAAYAVIAISRIAPDQVIFEGRVVHEAYFAEEVAPETARAAAASWHE